jgi:hypothetical protein
MPTGANQYELVIPVLLAAGCAAQFHRPDQLVVCRKEPVLTGRIWISWRDQWFISTWVPAIYSLPGDCDVVALCVACVTHDCASERFYRIPDSIVQQFGLRLLAESEADQWLSLCEPTDEP